MRLSQCLFRIVTGIVKTLNQIQPFFFFFFFKIFSMWTIFKVFIEFVAIILLFQVLAFWHVDS